MLRGNLLVLVRAMRSPEVQPPCADVWHSHVLLTRITHHDVRRATLHGAACLADLTAMMHRSAGAPFKRAVEQARRCAQSGLPSSVGFGAEDPRFAQLGNALHVSANGIKPQLHLDCASIGSWRSMSLQRLVPSGVPVQLSWKGAPDETDPELGCSSSMTGNPASSSRLSPTLCSRCEPTAGASSSTKRATRFSSAALADSPYTAA